MHSAPKPSTRTFSGRDRVLRQAAVLDGLEPRRLLSVAYDNQVLAQTGAGGVTAISPSVSINDSGAVAFQGNTASDNGVFAGDGTAAFPIKEIDPGVGVAGTTFTQFLQLNNANQIVVSQRQPGPKSFIDILNAKTGASTQIKGASAGTGVFSTLLFPVINNKGAVVYSALKNDVNDSSQYLENAAGQELSLSPTLIQLRMDMADNGTIVLRKGNTPTSGIITFNSALSGAANIATSGTYSALGQSPGISEDGASVVFYGFTAAGPGIFLSIGGKTTQIVSIKKDASGKVTGPISAISADTRVDIALTNKVGMDGYVTFVATGADGKQGVYTVVVHDTKTGITAETPVMVAETGQTLAKLAGTVTGFSFYDPINIHGALGYTVTTSTGATAVVRADPVRRPVLVVPGIAGSFAENTAGFNLWLTHRGIPPSGLAIDPLARTYDDLIQSFVNQGYVLGKDLFAATYDWRVDPGPVPANSAKPTGHVAGLTGDNITDTTYKYGVDYLGYWLKQADEQWEKRFGSALDSVDIVAHSTGGLVARTYIESDAYGATYTDPTYGKIKLPKVNDFVMAGVPNRGAGGPINPLVDNWNSDPSTAGFLAKILYTAYLKVVAGQTISGPDYNINLASITVNGQPNLVKFIQTYCPTLRDLAATYPAVRTSAGAPLTTLAGNASLASLNNALLNNLNGGTDANAFADLINKAVVVYGEGQSTVTSVIQRKGPDETGGFGDPPVFLPIFSMADGVSAGLSGHQPGANETWYEDEAVQDGGDGTVPLQSSETEFASDKRFTVKGFDVNHLQTVSNVDAQTYILQQLGVVITGAISTGLAGAAVGVLKDNVVSMVQDPVDAILTDSKGRRLGYSAATGPLNEIPGSVYYGDANGIGFIFGAMPGAMTLKVTGIGSAYNVQINDIQSSVTGGVTTSGTLAKGVSKSFAFTPAAAGNKPPVAGNDAAKTPAGKAVVISVLTNDADPNSGATITASTVKITTAPAHGKATVDSTGKITYTPTAGYSGSDTLKYTVADSLGLTSNIGTVTITVSPVPTDVSTKVKVTQAAATRVGTTTHYSQKVTITNTGTTALTAPLSFVLDTLTSGVTLNNKTGVTAVVSPLNDPYLVLSLGSATTLAAGKSVVVTLDFIDAANKAISYKWRLLSGTGTP